MAVATRSRRRKGLLLFSGFFWLLFTQPFAFASVKDAQGEVKNPAYGEVLYQFYQQRYFDAIVHLTASLQKAAMPEQGSEPELLLGGLYLAYGMHDEAERLLGRLLADSDDASLHDRVFFYLAKSRYQRGLQREAEETLKRIKGALPPLQQQERLMIHAQLLMKQGRDREAVALLDTLQGDSEWTPFGRYNLAIARLRLGQEQNGRELLDDIGLLETADEELASLRDRANLTQGSLLLQRGQPQEAKNYFDRIRLKSLLSSDALLAAGWGYAEQENYPEALVHWLELRERPAAEPAVRDALLAIPYAFLQLNAKPQAVEHYTHAVDSYQREMTAVAKAQDEVRSGAFMRRYLSRVDQRLDPMPEDALANYLQPLLVSHEFQAAMQSLNDLFAIKKSLALWSSELATFDTMLAARRENFSQKLPLVEQSLERDKFEQLKQQQRKLQARVAQIKADDDVLALATVQEKRLLQRLNEVDQQLQRVGDKVDQESLQQHNALFRGILLWQANADFKGRLWSSEKGLLEIERLLKQIASQQVAVEEARQRLPAQFQSFAKQIVDMEAQVKSLQPLVDQLIEKQSKAVTELTLTQLAGQQQLLENYLAQAQFAIAQIHDSVLKQSEKQAEAVMEEGDLQ